MKKTPVVWFEIPTNDLNRARKFYEEVFACELTPMGSGDMKMFQFPTKNDAYGTSGMLVQMEGYKPAMTGTLVYFSVSDIDETLNRVIVAGGKISLPKMSIGEYGVIAHFEDSEGNKVGIHAMA